MKFRLDAKVTVSASTVIEAESLNQAMEMAKNRSVVFWQPGEDYAESWVCDDADGAPFDITPQED